ncbi:DUF3486 family protein [Oleomonas cavernae]|nr:DUF3486 family protein [Oleomonas cavernae]
MPRPSKIDRLPPEVRNRIGALRQAGHTLDEIVERINEALGTMASDPISRSAMGRHLAEMDELGKEMRAQRAMAEGILAKYGDQPDDKLFRLNLELMQGLLFKFSRAAMQGQGVVLGPEELLFATGAMKNIASAAKTDADRIEKIEKRATEKAKRDAVKAAEGVMKQRGMSRDTIDEIKKQILGVAA